MNFTRDEPQRRIRRGTGLTLLERVHSGQCSADINTRSLEVAQQRPHTSSGVLRSDSSNESFETALETLPSRPAFPPIRQSSLRSSPRLVGSTDAEIGLAIGSPTDIPPPEYSSFDPFASGAAAASANERVERLEAAKSKPKLSRLHRWKSVSGLFNRAKTNVQPTPSLSKESENVTSFDPVGRRSTATEREPRHRRSLSFIRGIRPKTQASDQAQPVPKIPTQFLNQGLGSNIAASRSRLDISIPSSGFDRYSVMFSHCLKQESQPQSLLERRKTSVGKLDLLSPTAPKPVEVIVDDTTISIPFADGIDSPSFHFSIFPPPPQRPAPVPSCSEAAANDNVGHDNEFAVYMDAPSPSPSLCPRLSPRLIFWSDCPPASPTPSDDKRWSEASYGMSPPSPSFYSIYCSTGSVVSITSTGSSPIATTKSPAISGSPSIFLSPEPSNGCWSEGELHAAGGGNPQKTTLQKPIPSPRARYGYDAPHSPLLAIAHTVSVYSGQAQRPHLKANRSAGNLGAARESRLGAAEKPSCTPRRTPTLIQTERRTSFAGEMGEGVCV